MGPCLKNSVKSDKTANWQVTLQPRQIADRKRTLSKWELREGAKNLPSEELPGLNTGIAIGDEVRKLNAG